MDMWPAYINATLEHVPDAHEKIAFDPFHVAKHIGDGVNKVRSEEQEFQIDRQRGSTFARQLRSAIQASSSLAPAL